MNKFSSKLKDYRNKSGFSQDYLADILKITQQQYSNLETGKSIVNGSQLIILAGLYNCTPNDLLGVKEIYMREMGKLDD